MGNSNTLLYYIKLTTPYLENLPNLTIVSYNKPNIEIDNTYIFLLTISEDNDIHYLHHIPLTN